MISLKSDSVVNRFKFLGQTGSPLTVQILPANAPSGIYLLCDFFELVTSDSGSAIHVTFAFNAPSGPVSGWTISTGTTVNSSPFTSAGQLVCQSSFIGTATPTVIDFATGVAATVTFTFDTPTVLRYNYSGSVVKL